MKRTSLLVVLLLLFPYAVNGGDLITTVDEMGERVRDLTRISSTATLPDSDLYDFRLTIANDLHRYGLAHRGGSHERR